MLLPLNFKCRTFQWEQSKQKYMEGLQDDKRGKVRENIIRKKKYMREKEREARKMYACVHVCVTYMRDR